jgi:hypothetical protein
MRFLWYAVLTFGIIYHGSIYIGNIEAFDETIESWSSYVERLGKYFKANKVDDALKVA